MPAASPPERARCVIVGGGVAGASIAYHLTELGWRDIVLLDRAELTSGSTFHSAGLVGQLRASVTLTRMMMYSVELYRRLDCGWVECGGLRLACSTERWEETRRQAGWAQTFGLPLELISGAEAAAAFPLMSGDGVVGASWLATDGYLDPARLTYALPLTPSFFSRDESYEARSDSIVVVAIDPPAREHQRTRGERHPSRALHH